MNLGKCQRCNKTVYQNEGFKVGPPGKELTVHKVALFCLFVLFCLSVFVFFNPQPKGLLYMSK